MPCPSHPNPLVQQIGNYTPATWQTYTGSMNIPTAAYTAIIILQNILTSVSLVSLCKYSLRLVKGTILQLVLQHAVHIFFVVFKKYICPSQRPKFSSSFPHEPSATSYSIITLIQPTPRHIPEDSNHHSHLNEKFKISYELNPRFPITLPSGPL